MFQLRPYQQRCVSRVLAHFRRESTPAVVVLPTGAGKSLVIAELARLARGRVLVLTHVKELVAQNHEKYEAYGVKAGIFSAGLERKDTSYSVTFGSIQSVVRAPQSFAKAFSLVVIDECHRVSLEKESQYGQVLARLKRYHPKLCLLGLTATPYRLGMGWIYEWHDGGWAAASESRFFKVCIDEVSLRELVNQSYLTPPVRLKAPVACYDFSQLTRVMGSSEFSLQEVEECLKAQRDLTPGIVAHLVSLAASCQGVMIFAASRAHAREVMALLPESQAALILGDTATEERDEIVQSFKAKTIKFLVNVSVLTTGFDAPHVDLIAILRPTESVSLYQQMVGRGLRLAPRKRKCLILDYTQLEHDIFAPEVGDPKPDSECTRVQVACPKCGFENLAWGIVDDEGGLVEHFARRCQAATTNATTGQRERCDYFFRFKLCEACGTENDVAAQQCRHCQQVMVTADKRLRKAMALKDCHVMRVDQMVLAETIDRKQRKRLEVTYVDLDGNPLREFFYLSSKSQQQAFQMHFVRMHDRVVGTKATVRSVAEVLAQQERFRSPKLVVAYKKRGFWEIREKIF